MSSSDIRCINLFNTQKKNFLENFLQKRKSNNLLSLPRTSSGKQWNPQVKLFYMSAEGVLMYIAIAAMLFYQKSTSVVEEQVNLSNKPMYSVGFTLLFTPSQVE